MDDLEFALIAGLLEDPQRYHNLKLEKDAFTNSIARNYFAFIGITISKTGTFITRTHTAKFLDNERVLISLKKLKIETTIDEFIEYIYRFKSNSEFGSIEKALTEEYIRRKMLEAADFLIEMSDNRRLSSSEIIRKASNKIDDLLYKQDNDLVALSMSEIVEREKKQLKSGLVTEYSPSGINIIDDFTNGVPTPSLIVPLAATKQGKSMLLYKMIMKKLEAGKNVMLYTIETGDVETSKKITSLASKVEYMKISKMKMSDGEKDQYYDAINDLNEKYSDHFFLMYNKGGSSVKDIEMKHESFKKAGKVIDSIFIDYMGLLKSDVTNKNKVETLLELPKELRVLSQKTNTDVVCPQQLHSRVSKLDIDEINEDSIFYISTVAHEATVSLILHKKDGENETKIKILRSRIHSTDDIYYFPNKNFDKCDIGEDELSPEFNFN